MKSPLNTQNSSAAADGVPPQDQPEQETQQDSDRKKEKDEDKDKQQQQQLEPLAAQQPATVLPPPPAEQQAQEQAQTDPPGFTKHPERNSYHLFGGEEYVGVGFYSGLSIVQCAEKCMADDWCSCVSFLSEGDGTDVAVTCWKHTKCNPDKFENTVQSKPFTVLVKNHWTEPPPPPPLPPAPPGICSRGWCDGKHPPDAVTVQAPPRQPPHPGSRLPGMLDGIDSGNRPLVPRIQMSSSQRAAYLRAVYGEGVPASATLDNFRLIDAAAMQVAGVAAPAVPFDGLCPAEVGWPFSGHHGSFDLPCTLYLYDGNNDVPRVPFRSNQWAEVARTKEPNIRCAGCAFSHFQGAWYYAARGSGIFINMGNTRAYPTHAVAMRDLLPDETFSMQGIIDRGRKDKDYQIYERLFKKAHSMGIDTLQFTQTCNTVCSQEIEIIETGGHGKYVCAVAVQMATGWNASKPCACSANLSQVQCGQPRNGGQCSAWLGKFNKQKRLVSGFTCTGRVSAGKFGGQDCASSHAQVARDAGAAKAAEWCMHRNVGCSGSNSSAATGGGGHCSGTCTNGKFAGKACDQAWATVRRDSGRIDNADKWCLSARGCTLDPKRSGHLQQYIVKKGFSNSDLLGGRE